MLLPRYVQPPVISFEAILDQSTANSPIVFILSPGSDPATDLMKLAERTGFGTNRLKFLAMGQGQEKVGWVQKLHFGDMTPAYVLAEVLCQARGVTKVLLCGG